MPAGGAADERGLVLPTRLMVFEHLGGRPGRARVHRDPARPAVPTPPARRPRGEHPTSKPSRPPRLPVAPATTPAAEARRSGAARSTSRSTTTPTCRAGRQDRPTGRSASGWNVVGSDNWYGTIDASTVYYPARTQAPPPAAGPRPRHHPGQARGRADALGPAHGDPDRRLLRADRTARGAPPRRLVGWTHGVTLRRRRPAYAELVRVGRRPAGRPRLRRHARPDRGGPRRSRRSTATRPRCWWHSPGRCCAVAVLTGRPARQVLALGGLDEVGDAIGETGRELVVLGSVRQRALELQCPPGGLPEAAVRAGQPDRRPAAAAAPSGREPRRGSRRRASRSRCTPGGCADPRAAFDRLLPVLSDAAQARNLAVEPGRLVIEVRATGHGQGPGAAPSRRGVRRARGALRRGRPRRRAGVRGGRRPARDGDARRCWCARAPTRSRRSGTSPTWWWTGPTACWSCSGGLHGRRWGPRAGEFLPARVASRERLGWRNRCAHSETAPYLGAQLIERGRGTRPVEAPATATRASDRRPSPDPAPDPRGVVPNPSRAESRPGEDEKEASLSSVSRPTSTGTVASCGRLRQRHRSRLPRVRQPPRSSARIYACLECFGPLEVAYDFPTVTREQIEAGPRNIWRYKALLPVPGRHRELAEHRARLHPAARGRQPRARARSGPAVGQGRLHQPHQLLQGPRGGVRAQRRPRARVEGVRVPVDGQPGERGRGGRGPRRA